MILHSILNYNVVSQFKFCWKVFPDKLLHGDGWYLKQENEAKKEIIQTRDSRSIWATCTSIHCCSPSYIILTLRTRWISRRLVLPWLPQTRRQSIRSVTKIFKKIRVSYVVRPSVQNNSVVRSSYILLSSYNNSVR